MVRLGKKEKEFIEVLKKQLNGKGRLYKDVAPKLYYLKSLKFVYASVSKIAKNLEEKGIIKNQYEGKRRERVVYLIKDEDC